MTKLSFLSPILDLIPDAARKPLRNGVYAAVLVALGSLLVPNQYKSEAQILPADPKAGSSGGMAAAAAVAGVGISTNEGSDAAFVDIVTSRWMAKKVLMETYEFRSKSWFFGGQVAHKETLYHFLKAKNMDRAVKLLKPILAAKRDLKSKILSITVETPSPELSEQIIHHAIKDLELFVEVKARTKGGNKALFTAQRLAEAKNQRDTIEQESEQFLNAHRNYSTSLDPLIRLQGNRLDNELKLRDQLVTTLSVNLEQSLLEEKNDIPILNVLDEGDLPIDKSGPPRALITILAFILLGGGTWVMPFLKAANAPAPGAPVQEP